MILTEPGPETTAGDSLTVNFRWLTMVAAIGVVFTTTCDEETNWLPVTVIVTPCCTSANVTSAGESDPITGTGLALPHKGFKVLLQPGRTRTASRLAIDRAQAREGMETPQKTPQILRRNALQPRFLVHASRRWQCTAGKEWLIR
jgi:hypothetical protein